MRRPAEAFTVTTSSDIPSTGGQPGNEVLGLDGSVALVRADGTPLRLDNTATSVTSFSGTLGATGLARTMTYSVGGLRPGQRIVVNVAWGNPTAGETLLPSLAGGAPSGAAILGNPVTAARGQVAFLSGAADASGVATLPVTLTASGAASFNVYAFASVGTDVTDVQTVPFA